MFKDETLEPINIKSDVLAEKYVRDQSCQTSTIEYKDKYSQSVLKVSSEVQTENEGVPAQVTRLRVDTSKKLSNFMLTVYPVISEQLAANIRSHAFDDYQLDELNSTDEINCASTFTKLLQDELRPTCLTWNSIGTTLASAFGCFDHLSWCTHHSFINLWNINQKNSSEPNKIIDTDNCITALSFHPTDPPLLLGGDFSGKIYMWDFSKEDNILAAFTGKESETHQESVNEILWLPSAGSIIKFITAGSDGNLFFWMYNKLKKHIGLLSSFQLTSEVIPRSVRRNTMRSGVVIGISCAALFSGEKNDILVGMENGDVYNCKESSNNFVVSAFNGHTATVNSISTSKKMRTWFATCSLDMSIHVYDITQVAPIHKIDPLCGYLFDIKWSLIKQACYVTTANGSILIYDIEVDSVQLRKSLIGADKKESINAVAMNHSNLKKFASCDSKGEVKIWESS